MPLFLAQGAGQDFLIALFNALTEGATYALIAVGYTMVYGIVRLINFAHGEVYMIGAVTAWWLFTVPQVPLWLALPAAMAVCAALGWFLERAAYRPLRGSTRLAALITAIGASLILQTVVQLALNPNPKSFSERWDARVKADFTPLFEAPREDAPRLETLNAGKEVPLWRGEVAAAKGWVAVAWKRRAGAEAEVAWLREDQVDVKQGLPAFLNANVFGEASRFKLPVKDVVIWVAAAAMMLGLHLLVQRTKLGKAMRACSQDLTTASLMGIEVNRVITATFMIGSAMAAVAAVLYSIHAGGQIKFNMGYYPGVIAFAAAVLGGIGNLQGALLGGMLLGVARSFFSAYVSSEYDFAVCFSLMILVIIVRPYGLLGKPSAVRA